MLLLISEGLLGPLFFFPRRSHLIGPPPIFLEQEALHDIEACFATLTFPWCFLRHPWGTHWGHLGERIVNMGTSWETHSEHGNIIGNIMGTQELIKFILAPPRSAF
jgi:hypothetical protein